MSETWQPGDPVYEEHAGHSCPACRTWWSADNMIECPTCGKKLGCEAEGCNRPRVGGSLLCAWHDVNGEQERTPMAGRDFDIDGQPWGTDPGPTPEARRRLLDAPRGEPSPMPQGPTIPVPSAEPGEVEYTWFDGRTVYQRPCPDCDKGLIYAPVRFCPTCGGDGVLVRFPEPAPDVGAT